MDGFQASCIHRYIWAPMKLSTSSLRDIFGTLITIVERLIGIIWYAHWRHYRMWIREWNQSCDFKTSRMWLQFDTAQGDVCTRHDDSRYLGSSWLSWCNVDGSCKVSADKSLLGGWICSSEKWIVHDCEAKQRDEIGPEISIVLECW